MEQFDVIFKQILDLVEANPEIEIEDLIEQKKEDLGIDDELMSQIIVAFQCADKFDEKFQSLQQAKANGTSRTEWLLGDIKETTAKNGLSDEQTEELISSLGKQFNKED